jgi:hypothetical protein
MYRVGKHAYAHSVYIREDHTRVMRFARQIAEQRGVSFSRFQTEIVAAFLTGEIDYLDAPVQALPRRLRNGEHFHHTGVPLQPRRRKRR